MKVDDADDGARSRATSTRSSQIRSLETKTSSERRWRSQFVNQIGNIGAILRAVVSAVFFTMLLVTANTMAQSVRERTSEIGVLKTLGFSNSGVLGWCSPSRC